MSSNEPTKPTSDIRPDKIDVQKYRKRPVVIEAVLWNGKNLETCKAFLDDDFICLVGRKDADSSTIPPENDVIEVRTKEGRLQATAPCYLIRGVQGEHYPCDPQIFEETYEVA